MKSSRLPVIFIGHGSPMNIIEDNTYTQMLKKISRDWIKPKSILVISAHWLSRGTKVVDVDQPKTIYDFQGFPSELYQVSYPAPGAKDLAKRIIELTVGKVSSDSHWGLDHGAWAVLHHLYPQHDIPVTQLSLSRELSWSEHYELAKKLKPLRDEGVLILSSGNLVHNLYVFKRETNGPAYPWAESFDQKVKEALEKRDDQAFLQSTIFTEEEFGQAHPTTEHFLPFLYTLGLKNAEDLCHFPFEEIQNGSIAMRCVEWDAPSFQTSRMLLRPLSFGDAHLLYDLDSDPAVVEYITGGKTSTLEDCHNVIDRVTKLHEKYHHKFGLWLAFDRVTHEFMGWFLFRPDKKDPDNTQVVELGYRFKQKFWGKGLASEGGKCFLDYGFQELKLEKIFAIAMKTNLKSQAVMKKLGMSYEYDYTETQLPEGLQTAVYYSLKNPNDSKW